jgi:hypothetical protein
MAKRWVMTAARKAWYQSKKKVGRYMEKQSFKRAYRSSEAAHKGMVKNMSFSRFGKNINKLSSVEKGLTAMAKHNPHKALRVHQLYVHDALMRRGVAGKALLTSVKASGKQFIQLIGIKGRR